MVGPEQSGPHFMEGFFMMRLTKAFMTRTRLLIRERAAKRRLMALDDRLLRDIGVPRSEIDFVMKTGLRRTQHFDF
jgi:uncharacterized protein YjiS (DUF1127 family)